jgi:tRNA (guanine-N7-)-methyltransferase
MEMEELKDRLLLFRNCELYVDSVYERELSLNTLFPDARRFVLEVGCGRGDFLVHYGREHPDEGIIGVEKEREFVERSIKRVVEAELRNVRLIWGLFESVIRLFPEVSLSAIYFNFPDPWHKRKHQKKRMINPETVEEMRRVLRRGGSVRLLTDHEGMFLHAVLSFVEGGFEVKSSLFGEEGYPQTKYMQRFCGSRPPYFLEATPR